MFRLAVSYYLNYYKPDFFFPESYMKKSPKTVEIEPDTSRKNNIYILITTTHSARAAFMHLREHILQISNTMDTKSTGTYIHIHTSISTRDRA